MKLKIVLVKHFDHVLLGVLVLFLLFSVYKAFIEREEKLKELSGNIDRYVRVIENEIKGADVRKEKVRDYLTELKLRFARPAVISPYPHDPFYPKPDIRVHDYLVLSVGKKPYTKKLIRRHLIELVQAKEDIVKVDFEYDPDEGASTVTIEPLRKGQAIVRIRDNQGRTYRWRVFAQEKPRTDPPNPPLDISFKAYGPVEAQGEITKPARVLISFRHDNPPQPIDGVGITTGAYIERKPEEAPDVEYVRLDKKFLVPATQQQIDVLWDRAEPPEVDIRKGEGEGAASAAGYEPITPAAGYVPPEAGERPLRRQRGRELGTPEMAVSEKPLKGAYVFLDTTVDPGESYIYRITTVSATTDTEPIPCKDPFVTALPILVPSLVDFSYLGGARIEITRPTPWEEGKSLAEAFSFIPGMTIRAKARIKRTVRINGVDRTRRVEVDFNTNCVMVDTISKLRRITYSVRNDWRNNKFSYKVKSSSNPLLLYLTPRGVPRTKAKKGETKRGAGEGVGRARERIGEEPVPRGPPDRGAY